jgi:hypothetical protein
MTCRPSGAFYPSSFFLLPSSFLFHPSSFILHPYLLLLFLRKKDKKELICKLKRDFMSKRKADAISNGIFLIGLAILIYTGAWWPGILLVLWATLATREYLTGRIYDLVVTTIILVGLFIVTILNLNWTIIVPVLLVLGGIHIIFREYCVAEGVEDEDIVEETEKEIEDGDEKTP